ncbi:uncharacterized protein LOC110029256 [Phalaenopsis equestris]|uniref:uncharacterized protein LOC110029256 n=1 Tax=Phalaenopsis equestris TaxID=78828 RepID=UPI0009E271E0|nr:uncharacterized protein LOC110029256 [Phalaenopsis equestris]
MESGEKGADADCENDADAWRKASTKAETSTGGWQGASAGWSKEASGKDKSDGFVGKSGNSASPKSGGDNLDSWGIKGKASLENNDDGWGKSAPSQVTITVPNNPWQSSFNSSVHSKAWRFGRGGGRGRNGAGGYEIIVVEESLVVAEAVAKVEAEGRIRVNLNRPAGEMDKKDSTGAFLINPRLVGAPPKLVAGAMVGTNMMVVTYLRGELLLRMLVEVKMT